MQEFFNWNMLATYAGAVLATALITQLLKGIPFITKLPTRLFSYIIALVILLLAAVFTKQMNLANGLLAFFNAAVVSFASNGAYDITNSAIFGTNANKNNADKEKQ